MEKLLHLPKKLDLWYSTFAQGRGFEKGEVMYAALREFAESRGFECSHPLSEHILHVKGNNKIFRCNLCGFLFYKKSNKTFVNGQIVDNIEIVSRIEKL